MIRYNLKIALRNILKNKSYSIINILGLAAGMMSTIFIVLWIADETSYDKFHKDAEHIFRIAWFNENPQTRTPHPMTFNLVRDLPEVEHAVSLTPIYGEGLTRPMRTVKRGALRFEEDGIFAADTSFFDIFSFEMITGNPKEALKNVGGMVITASMAKKYFGDEDPLGQQLLINFGTDFPLTVTGVIKDIPDNSHLKFDFLISYLTTRPYMPESFYGWEDFGHYNYIKTTKQTNSVALEQKINEWTKKYIEYAEGNLNALDEGRIRFKLQPITSIHLHSNIRWELEPNGNITYVKIFSTLAIFIILIACINFMNLASASAINRSVEIGLKKAVGASRMQLIRQFYGEALLSALIAIGIALILYELLADKLGTITEKRFFLDYGDPANVTGVALLVLVCTFIAGTYPALILSRINVSNIIKGMPPGLKQKFNFRRALVVFQFGISTFLIIGALIIAAQLKYLRNQKMGFDSEQLLVIPIKDDMMKNNYESTKNEFLVNSNILSVSAVSNIPGRSFNQNPVRWKEDQELFTDVSEYSVDHDFFKTIGLEIIGGRQFSKDRDTDLEYAFIINQETASRFEWKDPVGEQLIWYDDDTTRHGQVIGVVEDFHFQSLHTPIEPLIINVFPSTFNYFLVKIDNVDIPSSIDHLKKTYSSVDHNNDFTFYFLDDDINRLYQSEENVEKIFTYFTFLAIIISSIGLFGLSSYDAERRTKEIGIRKVNGATSWKIITLLTRDFLKWVLIAFIVACPFGWFIMTNWLNNFAYSIDISWLSFFITGIAVFAIGFLTVSIHSLRTARKNPVDVLRYE